MHAGRIQGIQGNVFQMVTFLFGLLKFNLKSDFVMDRDYFYTLKIFKRKRRRKMMGIKVELNVPDS